MATGLTSDLDFTLKKSMAKARSYRVNISPIQGGQALNPGDTAKFDIQGVGRKNTYLDGAGTFLQFKVKNTDTTASTTFNVDGCAASFFNRLSIYSGGALIEDILAYNVLYNAMLDAQVNSADRQTTVSVTMGCDALAVGAGVDLQRGGPTIAIGGSQVFNLPLISGVLGNQCSKYLPLCAIKNDLRLELVLENLKNAIVSSSATANWQITEIQLICQLLELSDEAQHMVDSITGGKYMISSETFRNAQTILPASSTADNILLPFRFSSIKGIMGMYRPQTAQNNFLDATITSRFNPFGSTTLGTACSLQLQIGSEYVPNVPLKYSEETFTELLKYFHKLGNQSMGGSIGYANWNVYTPFTSPVVAAENTAAYAPHYVTLAQSCGSALFGLDLDSVMNRSDVMHAGKSTLNQNVFWNGTYATALPAGQTRFDAWAHLDMILVVDENGVLTSML